MKITIELDDIQVKVYKEYLKEISGERMPRINKTHIAREIMGAINETMQAGALGEYYKHYTGLAIKKWEEDLANQWHHTVNNS